MITWNPTWNPYLFGSLILMGFWSAGLVVVRRRRDVLALREFWWASFACALLGVTEPLFVPEYWTPPSILQVGRWDLESFIFCFAVGGITEVFPEMPRVRRVFEGISSALALFAGRVKKSMMAWLTLGSVLESAESPEAADDTLTRPEVVQDNMILVAAFLGAFGATAHFKLNIIYDSAIVCVVMACFVGWRRPSLRWQILSGGASFTLIYAITLRVVGHVYPTFYVDHWNLAQLSNRWILGAPAEEYLFALTLGLFWSPLYEAWKDVQVVYSTGSNRFAAGQPPRSPSSE
jgi:hypothetical protein